MSKSKIAAISAALFLSACGGGSGGTSTPAAAVVPAVTAEGLWKGTTGNGRSISAIVLDDGNAWVLYSVQNSSLIGGAVQGLGVSNNGSFATSNALDFNLEGSGIIAANVSASFVQKKTFNGTITYPSVNQTVSFTSAYSADYDIAPSIATIAGSYAGESAVKGGSESGTVTIDASGKFVSVGAGGCTSSGTIVPRAKGNVYNLSITYGVDKCATPGATVAGIGYFDATAKRLYGLALNASRTDGAIFVGVKK